MAEVRKLPAQAKVITDAVLTRGGRIHQGWAADIAGKGFVYYETWHYPGALNYQKIEQLASKPDWAL
jgi:hypothetical protein